MERNCLILTGLVISCVLFMQIGCQKQARLTEERTTLLKDEEAKPAPEPQVVVEAPKAMVIAKKAEVETPETATQVNQPAPKIVFDKEVCDFGDVGPGTTKTCDFKFTNAGDSPLEIRDIQKCCGVVAKVGKRKYLPGESGTLTVQPRFGSGPGSWSRRVYVNSTDKERPRVALTIKAKIVAKVDWEPKRLKFSPKKDEAGCPDITLRCLDSQPFSITGFTSTGNCITVDYDSSVEATKFILQPEIDLEKLRKGRNGVIRISLTHPDFNAVTIVFDVLPKFTITPPTVAVFDAVPNRPVVRKVWVLNNVGEDFEVESTSSRNNIVRVLGQEKVGKGYQLEVEVTPPAIEGGRRMFTDVLSVNIEGGENLMVSCRGFYSQPKGTSRVPVKRGGGPTVRRR